MSDDPRYSLDAAREAAERDELADWVAEFLASPGSDNGALAVQLSEPPRWWIGPVRVPLDQLNRLAGPPEDPVLCSTDEDEWPEGVDEMTERIREGWEPPPVIVSWRDGQLVLEDGNHRVESLRRAGLPESWAVIAFEDRDELERFSTAIGAD